MSIRAIARTRRLFSKCSRPTLQRKLNAKTSSYAGAALQSMNINPQQELELAQYIKELSGAGFPPTRAMTRNFGSFRAKKPMFTTLGFPISEEKS
jgi:hypothetical protein